MTNRPRALDLFCCGGGVSEGLRRAGFEVVGVDIVDHSRVYRRGPGRLCLEAPATFVQADALDILGYVAAGGPFDLGPFDFIWASPPCQAHSSLRHLQAGKEYPDLIPQTAELLVRWGGLWCIENVPGAPLGGCNLTMLCGTMFGLQTPDGRAELRRHRLFETSFSIPLRPACQHGHESSLRLRPRALSVAGNTAEISKGWERCPSTKRKVLTVTGHTPVDNTGRQRVIWAGGKAMARGMMTPQGELKRRAISITGNTAQTNLERNTVRETFSTDDARHAMGIDWMPMKQLSQAIPPAYAEWIRQAGTRSASLLPLVTPLAAPPRWRHDPHQEPPAIPADSGPPRDDPDAPPDEGGPPAHERRQSSPEAE